VTNTKTFGESVGVPTGYLVAAYAVLVVVWIAAVSSAVLAVRRDARSVAQPA